MTGVDDRTQGEQFASDCLIRQRIPISGAVSRMRRSSPRVGLTCPVHRDRRDCRKIAEQISRAFAIEINKDVVRRILIRHYRPVPGGDGPSWLTVIGHAKDSLWSADFFRCESILLKSYWIMVVMDVFTRRIIGFGVAAADLDGPIICRMFNRAIAKQTPPKYLSSDHDPLFRFHRWLANLRILEVDEIKAIPGTPRSHAFVERLIGTVRREYLDRTLFWNQGDLERKLENYTVYYNQHRCHTGLAGATPAERCGVPAQPIANLQLPGGYIAMAYFTPHLLPELKFDTDRSSSTGASTCRPARS